MITTFSPVNGSVQKDDTQTQLLEIKKPKLYVLWTVAFCARTIQDVLKDLGGSKRMDYRLDRFQSALNHLGNPEKSIPAILVGGTNGKGSTTLLLAHSLHKAGYEIASYYSPHLISLEERFLYNSLPIEKAELDSLGIEFEPIAKKFDLTYFEYLTLIFFVWARRSQADWIVLEVGLGGMLDATNVTNPKLSVLTNVALDHQEILGETREKILSDKIQIGRPGAILVTGIEETKLLSQAKEYCTAQGIELIVPTPLKRSHSDWSGQQLESDEISLWIRDPSNAQIKNTQLAYTALRTAFPEISTKCIQEAFSEICFPGKFEVVHRSPRVVLCAAHNPHGLYQLLETLSALTYDKLLCVCSFSADKPYAEMYELLSQNTDDILLTEVPNARTDTPKEYKSVGKFVSSFEDAIQRQLEKTGESDTLLITGSSYLVGAARPLWRSSIHFVERSSIAARRSHPKWDESNPARPH